LIADVSGIFGFWPRPAVRFYKIKIHKKLWSPVLLPCRKTVEATANFELAQKRLPEFPRPTEMAPATTSSNRDRLVAICGSSNHCVGASGWMLGSMPTAAHKCGAGPDEFPNLSLAPELSSDPDPSSPRQFCPDYIIATRGYDFQEGQG
jgi:hypothetical protein